MRTHPKIAVIGVRSSWRHRHQELVLQVAGVFGLAPCLLLPGECFLEPLVGFTQAGGFETLDVAQLLLDPRPRVHLPQQDQHDAAERQRQRGERERRRPPLVTPVGEDLVAVQRHRDNERRRLERVIRRDEARTAGLQRTVDDPRSPRSPRFRGLLEHRIAGRRLAERIGRGWLAEHHEPVGVEHRDAALLADIHRPDEFAVRLGRDRGDNDAIGRTVGIGEAASDGDHVSRAIEGQDRRIDYELVASGSRHVPVDVLLATRLPDELLVGRVSNDAAGIGDADGAAAAHRDVCRLEQRLPGSAGSRRATDLARVHRKLRERGVRDRECPAHVLGDDRRAIRRPQLRVVQRLLTKRPQIRDLQAGNRAEHRHGERNDEGFRPALQDRNDVG